MATSSSPSSEDVTSLYGRWTYLPGGPGIIQGQQQFDMIDPSTGEQVGTFDALVSRGNGYDYTNLLVTSTDGTEVGAGKGQLPPVGSLISRLKIGLIGWSYTAMPTDTGDVVTFKLLTPLGDIPIPMPYDGAAGIADHTFDNRPMKLTNGYSIAPTDPNAEILTGTSGILPLWSATQGKQKFTVYNDAGEPVGTFDGVFTTTSDILGTYTQAVLVTSTEGNEASAVGTGAGQVPPAGTVYNVVYSGNDNTYVLYTSKPSPSGDVVTVESVTPDGFKVSSGKFMDASAEQSIYAVSAKRTHVRVHVCVDPDRRQRSATPGRCRSRTISSSTYSTRTATRSAASTPTCRRNGIYSGSAASRCSSPESPAARPASGQTTFRRSGRY